MTEKDAEKAGRRDFRRGRLPVVPPPNVPLRIKRAYLTAYEADRQEAERCRCRRSVPLYVLAVALCGLLAGCAAPGHTPSPDPAVTYLAGRWSGTLTDRRDGLLIAQLELTPAGGRLWDASLLLYRPGQATAYSRTLAFQLRGDPRADGELVLASTPVELLSLHATVMADRRYLAAQVVDRHGDAARLALSHTQPNPPSAVAHHR